MNDFHLDFSTKFSFKCKYKLKQSEKPKSRSRTSFTWLSWCSYAYVYVATFLLYVLKSSIFSHWNLVERNFCDFLFIYTVRKSTNEINSMLAQLDAIIWSQSVCKTIYDAFLRRSYEMEHPVSLHQGHNFSSKTTLFGCIS